MTQGSYHAADLGELKAESTWRGLLVRPRATLGAIASEAAVWAAARSVLTCGGVWAGFCLLLWRDGHAPSRVLVPLPSANYYLAQALFVVPLLLVCWAVLSVVAHFLARALGGRGALRATFATLGASYAVPLLLAFVLPDLVVYASFGFEALGKLVRVTGIVLVAWELMLATWAVEVVHGLRRRRALPVALVALSFQAALGATFLR